MTGFIFRDKRGRKACKALDAQQRTTWAFTPHYQEDRQQKAFYNRKKQAHARYDDGMGFVLH